MLAKYKSCCNASRPGRLQSVTSACARARALRPRCIHCLSPTPGREPFSGDALLLAQPSRLHSALHPPPCPPPPPACREFQRQAEGALRVALGALAGALQGQGLDAARLARLCEQALHEEAARLEAGVAALLGPLGESQRSLSRDVVKPTVRLPLLPLLRRAQPLPNPALPERAAPRCASCPAACLPAPLPTWPPPPPAAASGDGAHG